MLHIGMDYMINSKDIVAILDKEVLNAKDTADLFQRMEEGSVTQITEEYSTVVLVCRDGKRHLYLSPISCATLLKRSVREVE